MNASEPSAVRAMLAWYQAMGVDEAVGDEPVNCFAEMMPAARQESALRRSTPPLRSATPRSPAAAVGGVTHAMAAEAASLAELEALLQQYDGCSLKRTAKSFCFARGSDQARIMLIGEAPGRDEDLQGKPFVGRAGQLLDKMLAAIGLGEGHVYITNTIYWRPPGNRTPTPEEIEACAPFLRRQIDLLAPKHLVLLGGAAAKNVLGVNEGIMRLRGKWLTYQSEASSIATLATLHPAYLLRRPEEKRHAWRDLLMLKRALEA